MRNIFRWLDDNIMSLVAGFLLVFIPLYPKLPFMDILPGYIVRVRLEDFLVGFSVLLWFLQLFRGKIKLKGNPLFFPIIAYLAVGVLSMISAVFIIKTVPQEVIHIQKMVLHFLRRAEYFSLFFIFYSSIKSMRMLKGYVALFFITVLAVSLYGFGQKYLYWPAYSTMNREFAKGWKLYLTEHARVISTFAGHYDLAAFIMMALILLWSIFFGLKNLILRLITFIILAASFWTLILTASRTSFLAYLAGLTFMFFFWAYRKGLFWSISRWLITVTLSIVVMLSFGDLSERFTKLLRIDQRVAGIKSLLMSPIGAPPKDRAYFLENNPDAALSEITAVSDQPPSRTRPSDVYEDIPLNIPSATDSSRITTTKRTYSQTAFKYDLSTAIRFDALWPMAIEGFMKNPVVGSGYSTLNKLSPTDFTEAESTDNDYLRALGETGFLGFVAFFGTLVFILYLIWRNLLVMKDSVTFSIFVGFAGLLFGLLVNAIYIDVFESSKVAFSFWAFAGLILGTLKLLKEKSKKQLPRPEIPNLARFRKRAGTKLISILKSDNFKLFTILILALFLRLYKINTPLADWHSWRQADTSAVTRNFVKRGGINLLFPTFDDLSNIASGQDNPKGLRFVEFPLYNGLSVVIDKLFVGYNIEVSGRLTSIFLSLGALIFLFSLTKKYLGVWGAFLASFFFAVLPFNVFYNRVILPEPFLVFSSMGMIYFFDSFTDKIFDPKSKKKNFLESVKILLYFVLSFIFAASALLIKPIAAFLFLPMMYLSIRKSSAKLKSLMFSLIFFLISFLPFIWWRNWMSQYPEGIPANLWLLNGDGIRFKGAFFYWIFADRLGRLILGYFGTFLLLTGILHRTKKEGFVFHLWGLSMLIYVTVFATGNVRHDYYQVFTIPIISIFLAKGVIYLSRISSNIWSKISTYALVFLSIIFMEMFSWYHVRDFYNINHPEIVAAGAEVDRTTPRKSLVIAPYNGDTAFLYQTNRAGWPIIQESIDNMINMGAHFYVSVNFDTLTKELIQDATIEDLTKRKYKLIKLTDSYVIIQLVPDKELPS